MIGSTFCEAPNCKGATIAGVKLGVAARGSDGKTKVVRNTIQPARLLGRGHGFIVQGRRVCGRCAADSDKPKKKRRRP